MNTENKLKALFTTGNFELSASRIKSLLNEYEFPVDFLANECILTASAKGIALAFTRLVESSVKLSCHPNTHHFTDPHNPDFCTRCGHYVFRTPAELWTPEVIDQYPSDSHLSAPTRSYLKALSDLRKTGMASYLNWELFRDEDQSEGSVEMFKALSGNSVIRMSNAVQLIRVCHLISIGSELI